MQINSLSYIKTNILFEIYRNDTLFNNPVILVKVY